MLALVTLAGCALVAVLAHPSRVSAGTTGLIFTVNLTSDQSDANTADPACDVDTGTAGDQCTLRAAIEQANAATGPDPDEIVFDIPGAGVHRIAPADYLPTSTGPLIIDGYTQPGASPNTKNVGHGDNAVIEIELSGKNLAPVAGSFGLDFGTGAAGSQVRGLAINRFPLGAIRIQANTLVAGNFIGTDPTGTKDRGNGALAVFVFTGTGTEVGGSTPAARNVISANHDSAVVSNPPIAVQGNYIGTASDGVSPLGNEVSPGRDMAVELLEGDNTVGGSGNAANVIAFNEGKGISVINDTTRAIISRNRMFGNGGIPIDLHDDGRTPNDPGDADTGPNSLLNFPDLKSAVAGAHHTKIIGVYKGFPAVAPYGIELFANPPHTNQAKQYIGTVHIDTDSAGHAKFRFRARRIAPGHTITSTATDDGGETSEVSPKVRVAAK